MTHAPKLSDTGEMMCSECFHDWPCASAAAVGDRAVDHDQMCPYAADGLSAPFCGWCKIVKVVRNDERERCIREAQEAISSIDVGALDDGRGSLSVVWRDGWEAGRRSALERND